MLNNLQVRSFQSGDFVAIGNWVTTTAKNVWISGNGAGSAKPAIIIGDDCMFSYDIVIRNPDAHPVFDVESGEQVNEPSGIVHVEPHVWVGEQVSILKSVTVGACSILSLGCVVTKDVPRFSIARGIPASASVRRDIFGPDLEVSRRKKKQNIILISIWSCSCWLVLHVSCELEVRAFDLEAESGAAIQCVIAKVF